MSISNTDNVIDSRDIIDRIEELESQMDSGDHLDSDETEELVTLKALADECSDYSPDFSYGEILVRQSYWEEYVQELCEDIGDIPKDLPSYIEIDWEATARNIAADYTTVEFDGVTYYIRCG